MHMFRRFLSLAAALCFAFPGVPAVAQSDTGEILVTVTDTSAAKAPIGDARVILVGPSIVSSLTSLSGQVHYTDVPSGIYRVRVSKSGFQSASSTEFQVLGGRAVDVNIILAKSQQLKIIGTVTVRSSATVSSTDVSSDSAVRRVSSSLTDALDKLAGVTVTQDSNDPNSPTTVSLRGHDESQTGISLDGIPLAAPGSAANLRSINSDLFSGARVGFGPSAGSLGGSVNFRTLEPTQSWQQKFTASYGTYDKLTYSAAATGSVGKLGIAAQHTFRRSGTPLTGSTYQDQSGLSYLHSGDSQALGDFIKLRLPFGDQRTTLNATALSSNTYADALCTQFVTNFPCGIGPGNSTTGRFNFAYGTLSSLIGNVAAQASVYGMRTTQNLDDLNRYLMVAGFPRRLPFASTQVTSAKGIALNASIAEKKHTFTLTGSTYDSNTTFSPTANAFVRPSSTGVSSATVGLIDQLKVNDKLTLNGRASYATVSGIGGSILGGLGATWRPQANDQLDASFNIGSAQPAAGVVRSLSDPYSARFNCAAGTTFVSGPGDQPSAQSSLSYDLTWTHQWKKGSLTASVYRQNQAGQLINAALNEPASSSLFPPGYINTVRGVWNSPFVCGGVPFNPNLIYVSQAIGSTTRLYDGFDLSARLALGPNIVIMPTYSTNVAEISASDARLLAANSTTIVGQQLPGRPVHRAGLTLDGVLPHSGLEYLANVQYTGGNNNRHLAPYTVTSLGLSRQVGNGRLTLFGTNVFNVDAGKFSTDLLAQPVPTSGGGQIVMAANPLTPRQLTLSYEFNVGAPPPQGSLQQVAAQSSREVGGEGGGPGRGPFGANFNIRLLAPPPGTDPLALALNRPTCDAEAQKTAGPLLASLKAYVAAYEAHAPLPALPGIIVIAHTTTSTATPYWLELQGDPKVFGAPPVRPSPNPGSAPVPTGPVTNASPPPNGQPRDPNRPRGNARLGQLFRAFFGCAYLNVLSYDEAKAKGITTTQRGLAYVPKLGLTIVTPKELPAGGGSIKK